MLEERCKRVTEQVSRATASRPQDDRFPAVASYARQYLLDESVTNSYAEFEVTRLANRTRGYQSDYTYAAQVRAH
jgi:hypothetical protein